MLADVAIGMIEFVQEGFDGHVSDVSGNNDMPTKIKNEKLVTMLDGSNTRRILQITFWSDVVLVIFRSNFQKCDNLWDGTTDNTLGIIT